MEVQQTKQNPERAKTTASKIIMAKRGSRKIVAFTAAESSKNL